MLTTLALIAAISLPPKPDHDVTDRAGVLPNAAALDRKQQFLVVGFVLVIIVELRFVVLIVRQQQ